jgi:hypothetical protein
MRHDEVRRVAIRSVILALVAGTSACGFLPLTRTSTNGTEVLERAPKPPPLDSEFDGCGPAGSRPDYVLNRRKNRVDEGRPVEVPWTMIARLPWPHTVAYRFRNQWSGGEARGVARYEGAAVSIEGYLAGFRVEVPEAPNCYGRAVDDRDFHMWLSEKPHQRDRQSVVVEITPRVRALHPAWTEDVFNTLVARQTCVRVSGWLLLDQMHPELVDINRITLWEVHPIMGVEVQRADSSWVPIDWAGLGPS